MTAEEFSKSEVNRGELAKLLKNPLLMTALGVLKKELEPQSSNLGIANPVVGAARYQQIAGANHLIDGLARLIKPYVAPKKLTGKALSTELPPET